VHVPQHNDHQGVMELGHPRHQLLGVQVDDLVQQRVLTGGDRDVPDDVVDIGFVVERQLLVRGCRVHRDQLDERQVERHVTADDRLLQLYVMSGRLGCPLSPGVR